MNDNLHVHEWIGKYLSKEITDREFSLLKEWLEEKPSHRKYFSEIVSLWDGADPVFSPVSIEEKNARKILFSHISFVSYAWSRCLFYWQRVAAVLLLPVAAMLLFMLLSEKNEEQRETFLTINCPYGTYLGVQLPDGSNVSLNSGSSLQYPAVFKRKERVVYLTGEGYFEVKSDAAHPFFVKTDRARVKATGTAFNVEAYPKERENAVTLIHGQVDVLWKGADRPVVLHPNDRIVFDSVTGNYDLSRSDDVYKWYAWKEGVLIFRDEPLKKVAERLSRVYHVNMTINDSVLAEYPYRATFVNKSLKDILELLALSAPLNIEIQNIAKKDSLIISPETQNIVISRR